MTKKKSRAKSSTIVGDGQKFPLKNYTGITSTMAELHDENGLINGNVLKESSKFRSGLSDGNGITNGNGIIDMSSEDLRMQNTYPILRGNGLLSRKEGNTLKHHKARQTLYASVVVSILIFSSIFAVILRSHPESMSIDGDFSDWKGVEKYPDSTTDSNISSLNIIDYAVKRDRLYLSFYLRTQGKILSGNDGKADIVHIFIDSDSSSSTGYLINGIGADYLLEIYGIDNAVIGADYYEFDAYYRTETKRGQDDWNAWSPMFNVDSAANGQELEAQLWTDELRIPAGVEPLIIFQIMSPDGVADFSDLIISPAGALKISLQGSMSVLSPGRDNEVGTITLEAVGKGVMLSTITLVQTSTARNTDIYRAVLEGEEGNYSTVMKNSRLVFHLNEPVIRGRKEFDLHLFLSTDAVEGGLIRLEVGDIGTNAGITHTGVISAFVINRPSGIRIDGDFSDWYGIPKMKDGKDSLPASVDIIEYSFASTGSDADFYLHTGGNILLGEFIPARQVRGLSEPQEPQEVGTAVPEGGIISFQPPSLPMLEGMDHIYILMDTGKEGKDDESGINADTMLVISGKYGVVKRTELFHYSQNTEKWVVASGEVKAAAYGDEIEISVDVLPVQAYMYIESWEGKKDTTRPISELEGTITVGVDRGNTNTYYVDDDAPPNGNGSESHPFQTINEALKYARDGDIIRVFDGNYTESLNIHARVSIIGNGSETNLTSFYGTTITIQYDGVKIENMNISNIQKSLENRSKGRGGELSYNNQSYKYYCIYVLHGNATISKNVFYNFTRGVKAQYVSNITIADNVFHSTGNISPYFALEMKNTIGSLIENNTIYGVKNGIHLIDTRDDVLKKNVVENCTRGIFIENSYNLTLRNNTMKNNTYNFGVVGRMLNDFEHDIDTSNIAYWGSLSGKIYYLLDRKNAVYNFSDAATLYLINSTNITLSGMTLFHNIHGIYLFMVKKATVNSIITSACYAGLYLRNVTDSEVKNNTMKSGIKGMIFHDTANTTFRNNLMENNTRNLGTYGDINLMLGTNDMDTSNMVKWGNSEAKKVYFGHDVTDLTFNSSSNAGVIWYLRAQNISISQVVLMHSDAGLAFLDSRDIEITNVSSSNNMVGIHGRRLSNITIMDSNLSGNTMGSLFNLTENITMQNCTLYFDPAWDGATEEVPNGISVENSHNISFLDIAVKQWYYGIYTQNTSAISIIKGNFSENSFGAFFEAEANITINSSIFRDGDMGIYAYGIKDMLISGSTFLNNTFGMFIRNSQNIMAEECNISKNTEGIYLMEGKKVELTNSTFYRNSNYGIEVDNSTGLFIFNLSFEGSWSPSSDGKSDTLPSEGGYGVYLLNVSNSSSDVLKFRNIFGVYLEDSMNYRFTNLSFQNVSIGMKLEDSRKITINSLWFGNGSTGILFESTEGCVVNNATFFNTTQYSVSLTDSEDSLLELVNVMEARGVALYQYNSTRTIFEKVRVNGTAELSSKDSDSYALYSESSRNLLLANSTFYGNANDSVYLVEEDTPRAFNLTLHHNGRGLYLNSIESGTFERIHSYSNIGMGVFIKYSTDVNLSGNFSNNSIGVEVYGGKKNLLYNSTVENNTKYGIYLNGITEGIRVRHTYIGSNINSSFYAISSSKVLLENSTIGKGNISFYLEGESKVVTLNSTFFENLSIGKDSVLVVKNYLNIYTNSSNGKPLEDVDVQVMDGNKTVYATSHYDGTDPTTGEDGYIRWIIVTDRTYRGSNTPVWNITNVSVNMEPIEFYSNPREVNMSTSHTETFRAKSALYIVDQEGNGDYTTITSAVENASAQDIIVIRTGIYRENVEVDKYLYFVGNSSDDPSKTVLDAMGGIGFNLSDTGTVIVDMLIKNGTTGISFENENSPTYLEDIRIENMTTGMNMKNITVEGKHIVVINSTTAFSLSANSSLIIRNSLFNSSGVSVDSGSKLVVKNDLRIAVNNSAGRWLQGVDVKVMDNNNTVYASVYFGGTDPRTDSSGYTDSIVVTDRIYDGSNIPEENKTTVEVHYMNFHFPDNPREVNMSIEHTEFFTTNRTVIIVDINGNGDFTKLSYALDNLSNGENIRVWAGNYTENVCIDIPNVKIVGNGTGITQFIPQDVYNSSFYIPAEGENVTLKGMSIKVEKKWYEAGVKVDGTKKVVLEELYIAGFNDGIYVYSSTDLLIHNVTVFNNTEAGIELYNTEKTRISHVNSTENGYYGLYAYNSSKNTILNSNFMNSTEEYESYGIYLTISDENIFRDIVIMGCDNSAYLDSSDRNEFNRTQLLDNGYGFYIYSSKNNRVNQMDIKDSYYAGIYLDNYATFNDFLSVHVENVTDGGGVNLYGYSDNNYFEGLHVFNCTSSQGGAEGIYLSSSSNNLFENASIDNCTTGIYSYLYSNNMLYNSTINNCTQDIVMEYSTVLTLVSTPFNESSFSINSTATLYYKNFVRIKVVNETGVPIEGAEIEIKEDGKVVYATPHYDGTRPVTDSNGYSPWVAVTYKIYRGTTNATLVNVTISVWNESYEDGFVNNSRTVNMSSLHHTEEFEAVPEFGMLLLPLSSAGLLAMAMRRLRGKRKQAFLDRKGGDTHD